MGLKGQVMGSILDVIVLAVSVQAGLISPAKSLQENIATAVVIVVSKWFIKRLLFS